MSVPNTSVLSCHFIGVVLTAIFYGITFNQTLLYIRKFERDSIYLKWLVCFMWALNTVQLSLVSKSLFDYVILSRGNLEALAHISRQYEASMGVTSIIGFMAELFYTVRIWKRTVFHPSAKAA